jgi:hypothetical protein
VNRPIFLAAAAAVGLAAPGAPAAPCDPTRVAADQGPLPEAWRRALDEAVEATSRPGRPWGCSGAVLSLTVGPEAAGAILHVQDEVGRSADRRLGAPEDLLPLVEAMLAAPVVRSTAARSAGAPDTGPSAAEIPPSSTEPVREAPREPRLILSALIGARYSAPTRALWVAPELRVAVPVDAWSVGVWVRYAAPYVLDTTPDDFFMAELGIGLALGRRLITAPIEIRATLEPSIAVVQMEGDIGVQHLEGARVDFRLGSRVEGAVRLGGRWRGLFSIDGELTPSGVGRTRRIDPSLPPLPTYGIGAGLGFGAVIQ